MKEIMPVLDVFELSNMGVVITGTNAELNKIADEEIKALFGREIIIESPNRKKIKAYIDSIDVSRSLIGRANISLCLGSSVKISDLEKGAKVFSIQQKNLQTTTSQSLYRLQHF